MPRDHGTSCERTLRPVGDQFHFHPDSYLELVRSEVPAYDRLQDEVCSAASGLQPRSILDLGAGTGVTSERVLAAYPDARLIGIDESDEMLEHARRLVPAGDFRVARLEEPLPDGPFDLVISALAVHHLDGPGKADLFRRVAVALTAGGRLVIGDVVVPENPADVIAPIDGEYDKPSPIPDQVAWLEQAGFRARVTWTEADLAVMLNRMPKHVASRTRDTVEWNNSTLIKGDVAEGVARLKADPGRELQVHGSADLAQTLMRHDLVDEYRLYFYPVVLGTGKRLFREGAVPAAMRLTETKRTSTGVVGHTYERAGKPEYGSFALDE